MAKTNGRRRRLALAGSQNWRCAYCSGVMAYDGEGPDLATIEHLTLGPHPRRNAWDQLVAACLACNMIRSARFGPRAFFRLRRYLSRTGRWPPCTWPPRRVRSLLCFVAPAEPNLGSWWERST